MKGRVTLMHKNDKVASCYFGKGQMLTQIYNVYNEALLPVVAQKNTLQNLQKWVLGRLTAKTREDFSVYRDFYGVDSKNLVSAMDGYWIKENKEECWEMMNPLNGFENNKDEVEMLVFRPERLLSEVLNWDSPNLTIPFDSESFLLREGEKFYLLQGSPKRKMDQYRLGVKNDIPLAKREYIMYNEKLFTKVELGVSDSLEYIPFEEYFLLFDKPKDLSHFESIVACCEHFRIPGSKEFLDKVVHFTELTKENDWRLSDIGVLRDSNTLEIKGFHPLI